MIQDFLNSKIGQIILSILLGFGLATVFRKVCKGNSCLVIKGPNPSDVQKYYYKIDEECYKYTPYVTKCEDKASKVSDESS